MDLAGLDLRGTYVGEANFDGANLEGAQLVGIEGDVGEFPTFVGANLTNANLHDVTVADLSGATVDGADLSQAAVYGAEGVDFSNAKVRGAYISDLSGAVFGDSDLTGAVLTFVDAADLKKVLGTLNYEEITFNLRELTAANAEIDLSGVDLTGTRISGPTLAGQDGVSHLIITSLEGAILSDTTFGGVDLSQLEGVDLTEVDIYGDNSICPDGGAPTEAEDGVLRYTCSG